MNTEEFYLPIDCLHILRHGHFIVFLLLPGNSRVVLLPGTVRGIFFVTSGDVGFYDIEGYFYIVDRLKAIIKYKGFQVIVTKVYL